MTVTMAATKVENEVVIEAFRHDPEELAKWWREANKIVAASNVLRPHRKMLDVIQQRFAARDEYFTTRIFIEVTGLDYRTAKYMLDRIHMPGYRGVMKLKVYNVNFIVTSRAFEKVRGGMDRTIFIAKLKDDSAPDEPQHRQEGIFENMPIPQDNQQQPTLLPATQESQDLIARGEKAMEAISTPMSVLPPHLVLHQNHIKTAMFYLNQCRTIDNKEQREHYIDDALDALETLIPR